MTPAGRAVDADSLDSDRLRTELRDRGIELKVSWRESTGSTQDDALAALRRGAGHGSVFGAERQTHGRGRRGRRWVGTPGGLAFSLVLRDVASLGRFWPVLAASVGVARAVQTVTRVAAQIKWPNDLVVGWRKLGGLLIETHGPDAVVGVGLNVNDGPAIVRGLPAVSIAEIAGWRIDRLTLLAELLPAILAALRATDAARAAVYAEWVERSAVHGRQVVVADGEARRAGQVVGFGPAGELLLQSNSGEQVTIVAGDVSLRVEPSPRI